MSTYLKFKTPLLLQCGTRLMALRRPLSVIEPVRTMCTGSPLAYVQLKVQKAP